MLITKKNILRFCEVGWQRSKPARQLYEDCTILECIWPRFGLDFFRGLLPRRFRSQGDSIIGAEVDKRQIGPDRHGYYVSPIYQTSGCVNNQAYATNAIVFVPRQSRHIGAFNLFIRFEKERLITQALKGCSPAFDFVCPSS
jgi:hypothetical protein